MKSMSIALLLACGHISVTNSSLIASQECVANELQIINASCTTEQEMVKFNRGDLVLEFTEGTLVPLHFFLDGNWLALVNDDQQNCIQIKRTFYMRLAENELSFSLNLTEWKSLLEFVTGTASLMIGAHDGTPAITLGAEASLR